MMPPKELEDQFYERVALELANNNYQPAPMARAVEKSAGNPDLAKSLYVKFRIEQLARDFKQETRRRQLEAEELAINPTDITSMPILKSYKNAEGHYILASVRGSVITFQLTGLSESMSRWS